MTVSPFATTGAAFGPGRALPRAVERLRLRLSISGEEAVTGRRTDLARHLGGQIDTLGSLERVRIESDNLSIRLRVAETRTRTAGNALDAVAEPLARLAADALAAAGRGDNATLRTLAIEAEAHLEASISALSVRVSERYIFSGTATGVRPLAAADDFTAGVAGFLSGVETAADARTQAAALTSAFDDTGPAGFFTGGLYRGATGGDTGTEVAPGERIDALPRADAGPLRRVLQGLAMLASAGQAGGLEVEARSVLVTAAADALRTGETGVTGMRARIGVAEDRVGRSLVRAESQSAFMAQQINALAGRDPLEAATEVQALETQLQTSFLVLGRLQRLSLTQFL